MSLHHVSATEDCFLVNESLSCQQQHQVAGVISRSFVAVTNSCICFLPPVNLHYNYPPSLPPAILPCVAWQHQQPLAGLSVNEARHPYICARACTPPVMRGAAKCALTLPPDGTDAWSTGFVSPDCALWCPWHELMKLLLNHFRSLYVSNPPCHPLGWEHCLLPVPPRRNIK